MHPYSGSLQIHQEVLLLLSSSASDWWWVNVGCYQQACNEFLHDMIVPWFFHIFQLIRCRTVHLRWCALSQFLLDDTLWRPQRHNTDIWLYTFTSVPVCSICVWFKHLAFHLSRSLWHSLLSPKLKYYDVYSGTWILIHLFHNSHN